MYGTSLVIFGDYEIWFCIPWRFHIQQMIITPMFHSNSHKKQFAFKQQVLIIFPVLYHFMVYIVWTPNIQFPYNCFHFFIIKLRNANMRIRRLIHSNTMKRKQFIGFCAANNQFTNNEGKFCQRKNIKWILDFTKNTKENILSFVVDS